MEDLFVGRQPILNKEGNLFAFELLYRHSQENSFPSINPEVATIKVIVNTFLSPGFEQIAARKTFINFSERLLVTNIFDTLDPKRVVIEVLEDVQMTEEIVGRLKQLKEDGFKIALDDFVLENQHHRFPILFEVVEYIKVDFLSTTREERKSIEMLKKTYPHLILLAEKVETEAEFEEAKKSGYELFQGYYFSKPEVVRNGKLPSDVLHYFELLRLLNNENTSVDQIARVVMRDVSLAFKVLKQTNTYAYQSLEKISSVRQAIVRIGLTELKKWVQFLTVYQEDFQGMKGRLKVLVNHSLVRANTCEMLAKHCKKRNADEYYMLGMFSLIDQILQRKRADIYPTLPVSTQIIETLCGVQTEMTIYLEIAEAIEAMDYDKAIQLARLLGIEKKELSNIVLRAYAAV